MDAEIIDVGTKLAWIFFFGCLGYVIWTLKNLDK